MIESYLRKNFDDHIFIPLAKRIARHAKITPMVLTTLGGLFGVIIIPCCYLNMPLAAFICMLASGCCDSLDGTLARFQQRCTPFGAFMDVLVDRLVEGSILVGLAILYPEKSLILLLMAISILLCVTSFLLVGVFVSEKSNKSFYYSAGLIERPEAFVLMGGMLLFQASITILGSLFCMLVCYTTIKRTLDFRDYSVANL